MKRRMVSILLCVVMLATALAVSVPMNVCPNGSETGLVAYWSFDEGEGTTAHDSVGDNDGTINGATWITGIVDSALNFDGTNDYVEVPDSDDLDGFDKMTVDFWFNPSENLDSNSARQDLLYKFHSHEYWGCTWAMTYSDHPGYFKFIVVNEDKISGGPDDNYAKCSYETQFIKGQWYYITGVYDSSDTIYLYINGDQKGAVVNKMYNKAIRDGSRELILGRSPWGENYFNGIIDEVHIWNRALSADEIKDYYDQMTTVAYWKFDEGSGNIAYDLSINNNHGTLHGDPEWVNGIQGNALEFDGVGDYIEVSDDPSLDITEGATIECWVKLNDFPGIYVYDIIGKGTSPVDRWRLDITSFGQSLRFKTGGDILIEYEVSFMLNTWYYFAVTWDGQIAIMYMNGINVGSDSIGIFSNPPANIFISSEAGLKDYVNGIVDEVRIWNRALSAEEVTERYNVGILPDLSITSDKITFSNPNPFVGETIQINASIYNIGYSSLGNVYPIINSPYDEYYPRWSPDGKKIAYISKEISDEEFWVYYLENKTKKCLTTIPMDHLWPGIGWLSNSEEFLYAYSEVTCVIKLYKVNITTGYNQFYYYGLRGSHAWLDVSNDDKYVVFCRQRGCWVYDNEIYRMDLDTSNITKFTSDNDVDSAPDISNDGKYIAYKDGSNNQIDILDINGNYIKQLTQSSSGHCENPNWYIDDKKVAYHSNKLGSFQIFLINVDTLEDVHLIGNSSFQCYEPSFSPDGTQIAFRSGTSPNRDIWIANCSATATVGFYDGDPENDGILIGTDEIAVWGDAITYASIEWTPTIGGAYEIYVRIEDVIPGDADLSNNIANKSILVLPIPATINIDPNTIHKNEKGEWVTCYIELPDGYDVRDIDASTILLEDTLSPELSREYGWVKSEKSYIMDHDGDGILERMVKFDRDDVEEMLSPGTYNLKVTGELDDGTVFEGYSDEIKVIDPP